MRFFYTYFFTFHDQGIYRGRDGKGSIFVWASGNGGRYKVIPLVDNMQNVLHQHDGVNIMVNVGRTTARYKVISLVDNDYVLHV